ncbi:MAG: hypothetical protein CVT64_11330 [Actinobacteria bacterium HGW-Actinobacteria-4]|nr:MAG: hypothetical protein CVT64_11330 [Actinobacteria bacterium HGW-Actinobacteria-4]
MGLFDLFRSTPPARPASGPDLDARTSVEGLRLRDLQVLEELISQGADPEAPRDATFYVQFPSVDAAKTCAEVLHGRGLEVRVERPSVGFLAEFPEDAHYRNVIARSTGRALMPGFLRETIDACEELAAAGDGMYDGWGGELTDAER